MECGRALGDPGTQRCSAPDLGGGTAQRCTHGVVSRQKGCYRHVSPAHALRTHEPHMWRAGRAGLRRHACPSVDSGPFGTTGGSGDVPVESVSGQSLADKRPACGRSGLALAPGPRCVGVAVSPLAPGGAVRAGGTGRRLWEEVPAWGAPQRVACCIVPRRPVLRGRPFSPPCSHRTQYHRRGAHRLAILSLSHGQDNASLSL